MAGAYLSSSENHSTIASLLNLESNNGESCYVATKTIRRFEIASTN